MSKKRTAYKITLTILNVLLILGLGFSSGFFYLKYQNLKNSSLTGDQRIAKYEKEISKSYTLPTGDQATLADVKNAAELKKDEANKDFFKDSQDGDVLLVYANSKLGILYRPSIKKIIKAGPVAFSQQVAANLVGAQVDRAAAAAVIKHAFSTTVNIATQADAKTALTSTVVVDVTGKNTELVKQLATALKGSVGTVPEGQDAPTAGTGIAIYVAPATNTIP